MHELLNSFYPVMNHYPILILSDIHLGSEYSRFREVIRFLENTSCETLILNGDIIDGWQLRKSTRHLTARHTDFFRLLMKKMEEQNTRIIYVRGNHDDFLDRIIPFHFANLSIVSEHMLETPGGQRYYVTHGDLFDTITSQMKWLAQLGDIGYTLLLHINKYYNMYRQKNGKPYYSVSQKVKGKIKSAVSYISDFEEKLVMIARLKKADGIICGHIHHAANIHYGNIHYLNSGDWVENRTALAFTQQGDWEIIHYHDWEANQTPAFTIYSPQTA